MPELAVKLDKSSTQLLHFFKCRRWRSRKLVLSLLEHLYKLPVHYIKILLTLKKYNNAKILSKQQPMIFIDAFPLLLEIYDKIIHYICALFIGIMAVHQQPIQFFFLLSRSFFFFLSKIMYTNRPYTDSSGEVKNTHKIQVIPQRTY